MQSLNLREQRGKQISLTQNTISKMNETDYIVQSQSGKGEYHVSKTFGGWICSCPDYLFRNLTCKHVFAVQFSFNLRQEVKKQSLVLEPISISKCNYCGSDSIKHLCIRRNKSGDIQRFICQNCNRTFSINLAFEKMKHNPKAVTAAMELYYQGESLRHTQESLKHIGVQVSHQTVYNWIVKYISLMESYASKIQPQVGDTWRADEIYMKVGGKQNYLFALMDDETRLIIAQEVAQTKQEHDARRLFRNAKEMMGKIPIKLITDGLGSYAKAYESEFRIPQRQTEHVREIMFDGKIHNNKHERLNGEIRDREKVMRGVKKADSKVISGYQLFHNYFRPHSALKGKTPGEACNIEIKGEDKWQTFIQNAKVNESKAPKPKERLEDF